jgi:tetratricopeptide (TPR) repeat protein
MNPSESNRNIENLNDFIEPSFYLGMNRDCKLPDDTDPSHAFNSFEYYLKQTPNDLSCHLQRLQFCISNKNRDALFASICDLFIVLGGQGLALRQRLFNTYSKVFTREQLALLSAHLAEDGLSENNESLPDGCFFKKEAVALLEQTKPSFSETKNGENILYIAESYIENSQFDTALEYMHEHLAQSPKNKALTLRLISLYKALNCADKFHSAYEKFSDNVATSLYWNDAKQHFLNQ